MKRKKNRGSWINEIKKGNKIQQNRTEKLSPPPKKKTKKNKKEMQNEKKYTKNRA